MHTVNAVTRNFPEKLGENRLTAFAVPGVNTCGCAPPSTSASGVFCPSPKTHESKESVQ
ncbi:hypothetical protein HMPREF0733_10597 [Rothia dentocariosa ATCC 17931]|uniref:Uncharacterized protein n=1 Tax=Rothia dentocariosa (strain ATCC 17931 / CDC X599 / XDIA) TaxID=762948 RepID=E3H152_ROTDC|nr:hypothetical protein HMPREF0733_10597 [Rothia dentocariosa ATCC 17931]